MRKLKLILSLLMLICFSVGNVWATEVTYSMTPNAVTTGSSSTSYWSTLTEFTYEDVTWQMNYLNPSTLQTKTNQASATAEFRFYNSTPFPGKITKVVLTYNALTLKDETTTGFMFVGGTSAVTGTTGGDNAVWDADNKTMTWTPASSSEFTYFAFYMNGKTATGSNFLAESDAIVVTYDKDESATPTCSTPTFSPASGASFSESLEVAIACTTEGAAIHYTLDGSDPTATSDTYSAAITLTETTTIKAIAVKDGANNSAIASATYTKYSAISGYDVDFESDLNAYADWEFTNLTRDNAITAHGGTYYAKTNGTNTAAATTKNKIAKPGVVTYYVSKIGTNTNANSFWYVEVSEDGSTWTRVGNQNAAAAGITQGTWTEYTADLTGQEGVYVRVYYSGTTAVRTIDDISIAMASAESVASPVIAPENSSFAGKVTVTLSCSTEDAKIYYTLDGSDPTTASTLYSVPFELTATTTVKAIAEKGGVLSTIAERAYTAMETSTCAEVAAMANNTEAALNQVTVNYVSTDGKYTYISDASGSLLIYVAAGGYGLNAGDVVKGLVGRVSIYNKLVEFVPSVEAAGLEVTAGTAPAPTLFTAVPTADDMNKYIRFEGVKVATGEFTAGSASSLDLTVGGSTVPLRNTFKYAQVFDSEKTYNVVGAVAVYNDAVQVYFISAEEASVTPTDVTLYFVNSSDWAEVYAYVWGDAGELNAWPGEAATKEAEQVNGHDLYSYTFPAQYGNIIFNNNNNGAQTGDEVAVWDASKPYFNLEDNTWYASIADIPAPAAPLEDGFYLIGQKGWDISALDASLKFELNSGEEYKLTATLAEGDKIKVVKVADNAISAWYPDGLDNEYTVDAAHAGANKDIYFQEEYKSDWAEFGGYFWTGENTIPPATYPDTLYVWDGIGSTTAAIEKGGEAEAVQADGTNIAVGASQKGNYCLKANKGFSSGKYYLGIALDEAVNAGDTVKIAYFRTSNSSTYVLGMDFSADKDNVATTYQILTTGDPEYLASNGAPEDKTFIVPEGVANAKYIRIYRNTGSTGLWVAKFVICKLDPTAAPEPEIKADDLNFGTIRIAYNETSVAIDTNIVVLGSLLTDEIVATTTSTDITIANSPLPAAGGTLQLHIVAPVGAFNETIVLKSGEVTKNVAVSGTVKLKAAPPVLPENAFRLTFNGTGKEGSDNSTAFDGESETLIADIFTDECKAKVASVETVEKVYAGRPIEEDDSSLKFGTSSDPGSLAFTLADAVEVDSIVARAAQYGDSEAMITINGTEFTLNAGNKKTQGCKITPSGAVDAISIVQSGSQRLYLRDIIVYTKQAPVTHTYTVAGVEALMGVNWDSTAVVNDMIEQSDGTYQLVKENVTLHKATNYEYKVAIDHKWHNGEAAENSVLTVEKDGIYNVTFTYDPDVPTTSAVATLIEEITIDPTAKIMGTLAQNGWDGDDLTLSSDKKSASITLTLVAGNYEFKMFINGSYRGMDGEGSTPYVFHRDWTEQGGITGNSVNNMVLSADVEGDYKVTWTFDNDSIAFTFPAKSVPTAIDNAELGEQAVKMLKDNQVVIIKGDKIYNAVGQRIR